MKFKYLNENNIRLDKFLSQEIDFLSREQVKKYVKNGCVFINSIVKTKPNQLIFFNDEITFLLEKTNFSKDLKPWPEGKMPKIIYSCDDYLIIDKPSGLVVHPGVGNIDNTLVNILISQDIPLSKIESNRPGIVHRIDKNTSGLLIIAKTNKFHDFILKTFSNGKIEKIYELITDGKYKTSKGIIDAPIGRNPYNRKLMMTTLKNSKPAKSIFFIKESFKYNEYVEFKILTGRTHQIRVHSKFMGAEIFNDPEYGKKVHNLEFGQYLHAKKISFTDMNGNVKIFHSELPKQMIEMLKELRALK